MNCCPLVISIFFLAALIGLGILFSCSVASSQDGIPMTIPITDYVLEDNKEYALAPTDSSSDSAYLAPITDAIELNVTASIVVYFYYIVVTIPIPELKMTQVVRKNLSNYYTCSTGNILFQLMPALFCISTATSLGNFFVSLKQICAKNTKILRHSLNLFIFLGFIFLGAAFGILCAGYFSSICGLPSLKDQKFSPNAGFFGLCIALGSNFIALILAAFL